MIDDLITFYSTLNNDLDNTFPSLTVLVVPGAISGSRPSPGSLIDVIIVVIRIVSINGLVGVVGIVAHHHVFSAGRRRTDGELFLRLIGSVAPVRPGAHGGTVVVMLAVLVPPHQPLERRREARIGRWPRGLLGHRRVRGVLIRIADDGDSLPLHLLLRCAPAPRRLVLRALAQDAENLAIVGPLESLAESRSLALPRIPLRVRRLQNENKRIDARIRVKWRAKDA